LRYDLLIAGGHVIDPANGIDEPRDVGIRAGRVAAVAPGLDPADAVQTWDAAGRLVTPGLVDLHTHVYAGVGPDGVDPDPIAWRTGVTTWVDAGSAGAATLEGLRRYVVPRCRSRVLAFVNISYTGLVGTGRELIDLDWANVERCVAAVRGAPGLAVGVKARIDASTVGEHGIEPLRRAAAAAEQLGLPLMVHIGHAPPSPDEVLPLLRAGDILTHTCTDLSMKVVDDDGTPRDSLLAARERGVVLDIGHGIRSFGWASAEALLAHGIAPDVISSDIHAWAMRGPLVDLPTCMSKFLALGMPLPDVVRAATSAPAQAVGRPDLGTLSVGAEADVAVFRVEEGHFAFYDGSHERRDGERRLRNVLTLREGLAMPPAVTRGPLPSDAWSRVEADVEQALRAAELPPSEVPAGFGEPEPQR
jgi:dihydroorotase